MAKLRKNALWIIAYGLLFYALLLAHAPNMVEAGECLQGDGRSTESGRSPTQQYCSTCKISTVVCFTVGSNCKWIENYECDLEIE